MSDDWDCCRMKMLRWKNHDTGEDRVNLFLVQGKYRRNFSYLSTKGRANIRLSVPLKSWMIFPIELLCITVPAVVYKVKSILLAQIHSDRVFNLPHEELQKQLVTRSLWLMQCFYTHGDNSQKQIRQNCRKKLHESVWALWNRLSCQLLVIRWAALELLTCADIVLKC